MDRRLELQSKLEKLNNVNKVYYQPPNSVMLQYPCIIYNDQVGKTIKASDGLYGYTDSYELMYISKKSNKQIVYDLLSTFKYIKFDRTYVYDGLYHYVFTIYY